MTKVKAKKAREYTVILVDAETIPTDAPSVSGVAEPPRYDPERDEPAFQKAWRKVAAKKAQGQLASIPALPPGGIRLRGMRAKQNK